MEKLINHIVTHPLEPLTGEEIVSTVNILRTTKQLTDKVRFISVVLKEPAKELVKNYSAENANQEDRQSFTVLYNSATREVYEAVVNINEKTVIAWDVITGVQPMLSMDEQMECEQAILNNPLFIEAVKEYGITDTSLIMVDIWSAGYYGHEEEKDMRLTRPLCFVRTDPTDNGYARPIEGLRPVVNIDTMEVIRIENYGHVDLPPNTGNYAASRMTNFRTDIKPLEVIQPEGPSFEVNGYQVSWQKWNFVIGFNAREGLTLHDLSYTDNGEKRSILYRVSLSEMVVPYGDPTDTQKRKNAFDTGEYGMGTCANSLELGCDCLGYIKYFDANMTIARATW